MSATARLAQLGLQLPAPPQPAASYRPASTAGSLVITAGQLPVVDGRLERTGRLGDGLTTAQGAELARIAALNMLAVAAAEAGGLDVLRAVKLTVFVACAEGFTEQHLVANGASDLVAAVLGEHGLHARSAVGVTSLPLGSPVEVEGLFSRG